MVTQLARHCKGWLYVNAETDPNFLPEAIKGQGSAVQVLPFKPSKASAPGSDRSRFVEGDKKSQG